MRNALVLSGLLLASCIEVDGELDVEHRITFAIEQKQKEILEDIITAYGATDGAGCYRDSSGSEQHVSFDDTSIPDGE